MTKLRSIYKKGIHVKLVIPASLALSIVSGTYWTTINIYEGRMERKGGKTQKSDVKTAIFKGANLCPCHKEEIKCSKKKKILASLGECIDFVLFNKNSSPGPTFRENVI